MRVPIPARKLTTEQLWPHFQRCGYAASNILRDISLPGNRNSALAGFAQRPFDTRSACFAAVNVLANPEEDAKACWNIGAPLTFLCHQGNLLWWSQSDAGPFQIGKPIP